MDDQCFLPPEHAVLCACVDGAVSSEEAFDRLYSLYAGPVLAWLRLRVCREAADDPFQEVWRIFLRRWRNWQHSPAMDDPDARPVLSFLYRTSHFVLKAHHRRERAPDCGREVRPRGRARAAAYVSHVSRVGGGTVLPRPLSPDPYRSQARSIAPSKLKFLRREKLSRDIVRVIG